MKRKGSPCYCSAYSFPHRAGGGKCNGGKEHRIIGRNECTCDEVSPVYCPVHTREVLAAMQRAGLIAAPGDARKAGQ